MPDDPHNLRAGHPAHLLDDQLARYRELLELARAQARAASAADMDAVEACLLRRNGVIRAITDGATTIRELGLGQGPGESAAVGEIRVLAQSVEAEDAKARECLEHHRDESARQLADLRRQARAGTGYAASARAPRFQDREV